ncbi:MAG: hypothetical protein V2A70_10740 [Candidatus Omnitrophota bacterium]
MGILVFFLSVVLFTSPSWALYFDGGSGDGFAISSTGFSRSWGFLGGSGRGESLILTASQTLMTFTSAAQTFNVGDPVTGASTLSIRQDTTIGSGVTNGTLIYVTIPATVFMTWDTDITSITATGKIASAVSYINSGKTLVLTANADFVDGDAVTAAGLQFKDFSMASVGQLLLDITGGAGASEPDFWLKTIQISDRTNGFLGGSGRGEVTLDIYQHPGGALDLGTFF